MRKCKCGTILETKAPQCRECARSYMNLRRIEALDQGVSKADVYNYTWRTKNPAAYLLHTARSRAKQKGFEFNLEIEDIQIPTNCPVFGIPLFIRRGGKEVGKNPNNPSLDRIDSTKGYIKGNIQVISWRANNLKSDGTLEEFKQLMEFMNAEKRPI